MAAISMDGIPITALPADAENINYDNSNSGLSAVQVQAAVDELKSELTDLGLSNILQAAPILLEGDADLNTITNVGVYGNVLYPSNLVHGPEPSNVNASRVKLLVSQTGSSLINSLEQQITIINVVSGANNTYKRQFLNNTWSDWTSYDKDIASLRSGLTNVETALAGKTPTVNNEQLIFN